LIDEDGEDLGPFSTPAPSWNPGHRIQISADQVLEVVRVVPRPKAPTSTPTWS
jgi:hypothetical protein